MVPDVPGLVLKSTEEILEVSKHIHDPNDMISQQETNMAEARQRLSQFAERHPDTASLGFLKNIFPAISVGIATAARPTPAAISISADCLLSTHTA